MTRRSFACLALFGPLCILAAQAAAADGRWSWQSAQAAVHPTGDLSWQPRPFVFRPGPSVRYIDFADGDDAHPGTSPRQPWKHHPWDPNATGRAKAARGAHTYVFKRGVVYRGALRPSESGTSDHPIRLTSDPAWGDGEAVLCGSQQVATWTRGADHPDIPDAEQVWYADLEFAPRCVWIVGADGGITRIPLARTPNWTVTDPDDVKSNWWHWDYKGERPFDVFAQHPRGHQLHLGVDTAHLTRPADHYRGAIVWTEHGWVAGGPYPVRVDLVDTDRHGLGFGGRWGGVGKYKIVRYNRYFLEDKPHYLDDPNGEFWFDRKGAGGRLYLRLPDGADPNTAHVEAARHSTLIDATALNHVEISGLTFRFTNVFWRLDGVPYTHGDDLDTACIRVLGSATGLQVSNCRFEHVSTALRASAPGYDDRIDQLAFTDNLLRFTDRGGVFISDGSPWGERERRTGLLGDVSILRNHLSRIGLRPTRFDHGFAFDLLGPRTAEIAGNIIERCYAGGINVHCAKRSGSLRDVPLSRVLIHHNKVVDSLLSVDDFGGIETWQGGPAYVYNNISGNPGGYRHFHKLSDKPGKARFGFAYYLDGAFKNYHFNNIAWGKSNDPASRLGNCAAFQEIYSYQNTFFNNTVSTFLRGSRRQRPEAGRNKYLGNIFQGISMTVFRHSDTLGLDPNIEDAGRQEEAFDYATNAYARNVFYDLDGLVGTFEASGGDYADLEAFRRALRRRKALAAEVGAMAPSAPLRDAGAHDFRPVGEAAARSAVKVFVPWALYGEAAEWNFYPAGGDPGRILDEHWSLTPYHTHRQDYRDSPRYDLAVVNVAADDYVSGPLEDWTAGALELNGRDQYATVANARLTEPFTYHVDWSEEREEGANVRTARGEDLRSPQIHRSSFLIEVYFRTAGGHTGGILIEKMDAAAGYSLAVNDDGGVRFLVRACSRSDEGDADAPAAEAALASASRVSDGAWHHVIAECDRAAGVMTLYVDGRRDAGGEAPGLGALSLANEADLVVGGSPRGRCFAGTLDFLRVALGTLADARTTIDELYAWQFDGPFLRDFTGRPTRPNRPRPAGAIDYRE
ncbi:MAG: LamG-like jellyroll fold domain-containing protein [Planctomycetota bacterium]